MTHLEAQLNVILRQYLSPYASCYRISTNFFPRYNQVYWVLQIAILKNTHKISYVFLAKIIFAKLFYYSSYFLYYSWVLLHFLIVFMSLTILFQLTFVSIYSTFNNKNFSFSKINRSQMNLKSTTWIGPNFYQTLKSLHTNFF